MNESITEIKDELIVTRKELLDRLNESESDDRFKSDFVASVYEREKDLLLNRHIREELKDVNRALLKMDCGMYGICEETGQKIPIDQLRILPTVRTIDETEKTTMLFVH